MTGEFAIAVHALVYLNHRGVALSSEALAKNICTNPARVRKVLGKLKKSGFIDTRVGIEGGYSLAADPDALTLADIAAALGETFVSAVWRSGDHDMDCLIASGMADVLDGIYAGLNRSCMEQLSCITVRDLDRRIFRHT